MRVLIKAAIIPLICLSISPGYALDLTKMNLAYQYDAYGTFDFNSRIAQADGKLHIYYTLESDNLRDYDQFFLMQNGYSSKSHDTLTSYTLDTLAFSAKMIYFRLTMPTTKKDLLLISLENSNQEMNRIYDVQTTSASGFPRFVPLTADGLPVLKNYVTTNEALISDTDETYHVYRYEDDFGPADPAMGITKQIAPRLEIDSSFYFENKITDLKTYHFYLIQSDTLADNGVTLLKCPSYYPEHKRLEELVKPLTYITTPNENRSLQSQPSKEAFERFWINTYGTKFRAKNAIRVFYDKVEEANRLFTNYKQGWKTDRGMLYIIFGPPGLVVRSDRNEIWVYEDGAEFEFIRISTLFTPSLYSLKRHKKYEELWYDQVGNIRKGL